MNGGNTIGSLSGLSAVLINCAGSSQTTLYGITAFGGAGTHDAVVSNNVIGSLTLNSTGTGNAKITGIGTSTGTHTGLTIQNNTIGSSSGPLQLNAISGTETGIELTTATNNSDYSCISNTIQNLYNNNTGSNADVYGVSFTFVSNNNVTAAISISNNQISNLGSTYSGTANGTVQGISFIQNGSLTNTANNGTISNNQISSLSSSSTGPSTMVRGIVNENAYSTILNITGNTIHALSSPSPNITASISCAIQGISSITSGTGAISISNNLIYDLENTASANTHVTGISCLHGNNTNTASLLKNKIYDLRNPNATSSADVTGILLRGSAASGTFHVGNNMISLYPDNIQVYGITNNATASLIHLYYNSISISGIANGSNNSGAFNRTAASSSPVAFASNIFHNSRTSGSGNHYALVNSNASPSTGWSSDYNDIYSSNSNTIVLRGNTDMDLTSYQTGSGQDAHSKSVAVNFTNLVTGDLHLSGSSIMDQNLGGLYSGPDDFDGDPRPGRPYVGADEVVSSPLPVTIGYFIATKQNNQNLLTWKVSCASPSIIFEIEKSIDGIHFSTIGNIVATQARCDLPFDFTDTQAGEKNYYRLKIVEFSGKTAYSFIIAILNNTKRFKVLGLYPNVVSGKAVLSLYSPVEMNLKIMLNDIQGKIIKRTSMLLNPGSSTMNMYLADLSAGIYTLRLINEKGESKAVRFIKQ